MRQWRRLGQIAGNTLNRPVLNALENRDQPVNVHRFGQTVLDGLLDERMLWDLAVARDVFEASELVGKNRRSG